MLLIVVSIASCSCSVVASGELKRFIVSASRVISLYIGSICINEVANEAIKYTIKQVNRTEINVRFLVV